MKIKKMIIGLMMTITVVTSGVSMADTNEYGAIGASIDSSYTLEEMLIYAIQDEFLARSEYDAIMEKYDVQRPFSNIIKSEETHIALLLPMFDQYGFEVPKDTSLDQLIVPESLLGAFEIGVQAEVNNIAMYEAFLSEEIPEDVRVVFERLLKSSESHLKAFENGLNRPTRGGRNRR